MSLSMYQASVPVLARAMTQLNHILDLGAAHAEQHKIDPIVLLNFRLFPDMFALTRQVQIATDVAKGCPARLAGQAPPSWDDNEASFAELKARVNKTIEFVNSYKPKDIDGSETRTVILKIRGNENSMSGRDYLFNFVIPNVHFHTTTTYALLRHNGVDLGKQDYIGDI